MQDQSQPDSSPLAAVERLRDAMNAHDLDDMVACFTGDVRSQQPAHPSRNFEGNATIRQNWTMIFAGVPDIHAEILRSAVKRETVWVDWKWSGTTRDGGEFDKRGVTILGIRDGRISEVTMYMEDIELAGQGNAVAIRQAVGAPQ